VKEEGHADDRNENFIDNFGLKSEGEKLLAMLW
jgi:hypothetical protein